MQCSGSCSGLLRLRPRRRRVGRASSSRSEMTRRRCRPRSTRRRQNLTAIKRGWLPYRASDPHIWTSLRSSKPTCRSSTRLTWATGATSRTWRRSWMRSTPTRLRRWPRAIAACRRCSAGCERRSSRCSVAKRGWTSARSTTQSTRTQPIRELNDRPAPRRGAAGVMAAAGFRAGWRRTRKARAAMRRTILGRRRRSQQKGTPRLSMVQGTSPAMGRMGSVVSLSSRRARVRKTATTMTTMMISRF
mmetsp:Transcript_8636/g.28440  ORF Transcript_8636/g.28440 Transcript_8636/m.28440 type:complete len:246 (-) Transcript_8636:360-1097(-)